MAGEQDTSTHSIVVFEQQPEAWRNVENNLAEDLPGSTVSFVNTPEQLRACINEPNTGVVVLDCNWEMPDLRQFIYELKNSDSDPALIILSEDANSKRITELYKHGCQRFIIKDERWLSELGLAIRQLMRYRQVVNENLKIRTKLTESNMLLDERNKRLDEFSATLAHDIRGPLGGISMKLEYLLDHAERELDQKSQEILKRALNSSERLTGIVQAMYEYAKLGAQASKMQRINLVELVNQVVADLSFDPALDIRVEIGELGYIWGNPGLISRVFINLISNAVKYSDKAEIAIRIKAETTQNKTIGRFREIVVEDNGPGIDEKNLPQLFSMFKRGVHQAGKEKSDGIGVGLAVVQRIIELHFGEIRVQSVPGQGTAFFFTLPVENVNIT